MMSAVRFPGKFSDEREENKVERGSDGGQEGEGRQGRAYKSSRVEPHLHSDMLLLLARSAALSLLVAVAVATQPGVACRQEVPAGLIRDLWNRTRELVDRLPVRTEVGARVQRSNRPAVSTATRGGGGGLPGVPQGSDLRPEP